MGAGSVGALVYVAVVVELIPFTPATSAATEEFIPSITPEFAGGVGAAPRADGCVMCAILPGACAAGPAGFADAISDLTQKK